VSQSQNVDAGVNMVPIMSGDRPGDSQGTRDHLDRKFSRLTVFGKIAQHVRLCES
jgi:hypothetical protein